MTCPDRCEIADSTLKVYHFRTDPRLMPSAPTVLLSNATAFSDPQAASRTRSDGPAPRPLAWVREGDLLNAPSQALGQGMDDPSGGLTYSGGAGRMFYTSLGHQNQTWEQPAFQAHVAGGIAWVLASTTTRANNASALIGQSANGTTSNSNGSDGASATSIALRNYPSKLIICSCISITFLSAIPLLF